MRFLVAAVWLVLVSSGFVFAQHFDLSLAETEISDYHALETVPVASLKTRLIPGDPRWDPWLRLVSEPLPQPPISSVAPRRIAGLTLAVLGLLLAIFLLPGWVRGRRKAREIVLVLGALALAAPMLMTSGSPDQGPQKASWSALFRQHLWYQTAYPFGLKWDDYRPGEPVVLSSVVRKGDRLVPVELPVETFDATWESQRAQALTPSNAARLLGLDFP